MFFFFLLIPLHLLKNPGQIINLIFIIIYLFWIRIFTFRNTKVTFPSAVFARDDSCNSHLSIPFPSPLYSLLSFTLLSYFVVLSPYAFSGYFWLTVFCFFLSFVFLFLFFCYDFHLFHSFIIIFFLCSDFCFVLVLFFSLCYHYFSFFFLSSVPLSIFLFRMLMITHLFRYLFFCISFSLTSSSYLHYLSIFLLSFICLRFIVLPFIMVCFLRKVSVSCLRFIFSCILLLFIYLFFCFYIPAFVSIFRRSHI